MTSPVTWERVTGDRIPADLHAACPTGFFDVLTATFKGDEPFWVFRARDSLSWHVYGPNGVWTVQGGSTRARGEGATWRKFLSPRTACLVVERGMSYRRSARFRT